MKIKHFRTKILLSILPIVILTFLAMAGVSLSTCRNELMSEKKSTMESELKGALNQISDTLQNVNTTVSNLSRAVANTYTVTDIKSYEELLTQLVQDNPNLLGCGLWFEPYVYDKAQQYVGPYAYRKGDTIDLTYEYSNSDYDYFNQPYYLSVSKGQKEAVLTDPYYDETLDVVMASYTMPIYDTAGAFLGAVTADLSLDTIQSIVQQIRIGEKGTAILLTAEGKYLSCEDTELVKNSESILEDKNPSLQKAAKVMFENERGTTSYKNKGESYQIYYDSMELNGWRLLIQMPDSELHRTVRQLFVILMSLFAAAIILDSLGVVITISQMIRPVMIVKEFASSLAHGDFTIQALKKKGNDEVAVMSESLNEMFFANKKMIGNISEESVNIKDSSKSLNQSAKVLVEEFGKINELIGEVNEAMMGSSAATEQVNASTEEVNSSVTLLSNEIKKNSESADLIKLRAKEVEEKSRQSFENASRMSEEYQKNLEQSIENAKVVEAIGEMANVIAGIAEQINLLSLNASIEAARAGDQGRGFAVVANEIGNLAKQTSTAVTQIQTTIEQVNNAFNVLTRDSSSMLSFVEETVTPDYDRFIQVARQYGDDAKSMEALTQQTAKMVQNIEEIMNEVTAAIDNIAESTQTTADHSQQIVSSVENMNQVVEEVANQSSRQEEVAIDMESVVKQYRID